MLLGHGLLITRYLPPNMHLHSYMHSHTRSLTPSTTCLLSHSPPPTHHTHPHPFVHVAGLALPITSLHRAMDKSPLNARQYTPQLVPLASPPTTSLVPGMHLNDIYRKCMYRKYMYRKCMYRCVVWSPVSTTCSYFLLRIRYLFVFSFETL